MDIPFDMKLTQYESSKISIDDRKKTFKEVDCGFDEKTAMKEAGRCFHCKNPKCVEGCPIKNRIPDFIEKVKNSDFDGAYKIISENSALSSVCGRVCDQSKQCEGNCVRGLKGEPIAIGKIERFVSDYFENREKQFEQECAVDQNLILFHESFQIDKETKKLWKICNDEKESKTKNLKVAIVGGGPAGLQCAYDLAKNDVDVTVFEKSKTFGGIMSSSIPEYRLPQYVVENAVKKIEKLGVKFEFSKVFGKNLSLKDLKENGFDAVFLSIGADNPKSMKIKGENLKNVYLAKNFLINSKKISLKQNLDEDLIKEIQDKIVVVIGGGNVAMDSARTAVRLGAKKVYIVYRRSETELPSRKDEIEDAKLEGVEFLLQTNPIEILGNSKREKNGNLINNLNKSADNDFVTAIKCIKMKLGEPDDSGRRRPIEIDGSEEEILCDFVIMAIGSGFENFEIEKEFNVKKERTGAIMVYSETGKTDDDFVYAGGDAVRGPSTIVHAMKDGKKVAQSILKKLKIENYLNWI